jgi:Xaa-Pro aminopeptidase
MPTDVSPRLARFRTSLAAAGLDAAVVSRPENVFYLTGAGTGLGRPALAVITSHHTALVAPHGTAHAPAVTLFPYGTPGGILDRIVDVDQESTAALAVAYTHLALAGARVGIEPGALSTLQAGVLAGATLIPLHEEIEALRRHLDADELALIRAAIQADEAGFAAAQAAIRPGVSELEVYLAAAAAIQTAAGMALTLNDSNHAFLSGPRTALVAGPATDRRLEAGDLMIIDVNPLIRHYKGDITRTFCVGRPTAAQQAMHVALVAALDRAMVLARPGMPGGVLEAAMRAVVSEAGYGAGISTHFGHGLGLAHPERPYIIPAEELALEEGMVLALEPGVYFPDGRGMRIEDNYLVTAQGLEPLSHFPREIIVCGA